MAWIVWIVAALILGIVELLTVDLFFLTLSLAALAAGIFALTGVALWVQILVFAVASGLMLGLVRPWARNMLARATPNIATNTQALVGRTAVITAPLGGSEGRVRLAGEEWSARAIPGWSFPVGMTVRVVEISGATAVVGPYEEAVPPPPDSVPPEAV